MAFPKPRPLYIPRPKLKRLPIGRKAVTVCIAAIAAEQYIVTLSDTKIGTPFSSSDGTSVKVDKVAQYFENRANTIQVARSCFKRAYQNHLSEIATDIVLGRFRIDMETFVKQGKRRFTEAVFNSLSSEIRKVEADSEFLCAGFDAKKYPCPYCLFGNSTKVILPFFCLGFHTSEGLVRPWYCMNQLLLYNYVALNLGD